MKKLLLLFFISVFLSACAAPLAKRSPSLMEQTTQQVVAPTAFSGPRPTTLSTAAVPTPSTTKAPLSDQKNLPPPSVMQEEQAGVHHSPLRYKAIPLPAQMRGAWIASVENIDWPSKPGLSSLQQQKEFTDLLDVLKKLKFNTVIVQVRPTADTFWPSQREPWSCYLTGQQGQRPSPYYDPLDFMIAQAHKRGLAFHAWFNPFRVTNKEQAALAPNHPALLHPDWLVTYDGKKYYNPAVPQARQHSIDVILETVKNYPIDAIHLDDYFYPYPVKKNKKEVPFPDQAAYKANGQGLSLADWRRKNVNTFIESLSQAIKREKPDVAFGISPFGVWRNKNTDPTGSATRAFSAYDDGLYADSRLWITQGWIDYVVPQLYWSFSHKAAPYGELLSWWNEEITRNPKVKLYIGLGTYKHAAEWKNKKELLNQLLSAQKANNVSGTVHFSAIRILKNQGGVQQLLKKVYK